MCVSKDTSVWWLWSSLTMLKILYSPKHQINPLQLAQIQFFIHFDKQKYVFALRTVLISTVSLYKSSSTAVLRNYKRVNVTSGLHVTEFFVD